MKDNFSDRSDLYKQYRPEYPSGLFKFIFEHVKRYHTAWDCGTGNGQIAKFLSPQFDRVFASDISDQQLAQAENLQNVTYSRQPAESTTFEDNTFDLIVVGQAAHWFAFDEFYTEARRTAKDGAILAIIGYNRPRIDSGIDRITDRLYKSIVGPFWDPERRYVDEQYRTIPFPFDEILCPEFSHVCTWSLEQLKGYLETWSAVKRYAQQRNTNPIDHIINDLRNIWGDGIRPVHFPILVRIGSIKKS